MSNARPKSVKLEWQGGLAENSPNDAQKVLLKGETISQNINKNNVDASIQKPQFLKLKREVKGRGGHPVIVLCEISPSLNDAALEAFAKLLKGKLGCGGTIENGAVILQTQQIDRIEKELVVQGIVSKRAGGF